MKPYLKGLFAGAVAALAFLSPSLDDGGLSAKEVVGTASAFLVAAGGVFFLPYETTKPSSENTTPDLY